MSLTPAQRNKRYREQLKLHPHAIGLSIGIADLQTPTELLKRELAARVEATKFARRLQQAIPDGSRCIQKACPFPAVLDGECRAHAHDRHTEASLIPSTHVLVTDRAIGITRGEW